MEKLHDSHKDEIDKFQREIEELRKTHEKMMETEMKQKDLHIRQQKDQLEKLTIDEKAKNEEIIKLTLQLKGIESLNSTL